MTDHEFIAQVSENQEKLRRELHAEVESLFKKEREALLERAHLFMNVAKWTAAAIAIVLGLLGIKAWDDVKANVQGYFTARLEKIYQIDDPSSPLSRGIDELLDRAVLNALYVQVQREHTKGDTRARPIQGRSNSENLTSGELDRLLRMLKLPKTDILAFTDAIYVLNHLAFGEERRQAVSSVLAELLAAREKTDSSWMASNETKRLLILSNFPKSEAIDAVAGDLLSRPISDRLRSAALARIEQEDYRAAAPMVIKLIDGAEETKSKFEAQRALARLRPDHERVRKFVLTDMLNRTEKNDLVRCLDLAAALAANVDRNTLDIDKLEKYRRMLAELAVPLAAKAIDAGVTLEYGDLGPGSGVRVRVPIGPDASRVEGIDPEIYSDDFVSQLMTFASAKSMADLARYVSAFSIDTGSIAAGRITARVYAELDSDSRIELRDGTILTSENAEGRSVRLVARWQSGFDAKPFGQSAKTLVGNNQAKEVLALWTDDNGTPLQNRIQAIKNVRYTVKGKLGRKQEEQ